ncbi:hypothetical protein [Streptomyces sp. NPDC014734]|uniref:hypothetical protein n=1 Tax=Streptomyces sp. NPDC014734 TaxID=3364886 RepID=UPI0036F94AFA
MSTAWAVVLSAVLGLSALLVWGLVFSDWRKSKSPQSPHDPAHYFHRRMDSWERAPGTLSSWQQGGPSATGDSTTDGVEVARILTLLDGTSSEDGGGVGARMELVLPDGSTTTVHTEVGNVRNVRPGMFVPVQPLPEGVSHVLGDMVELASDLSEPNVRSVLLEHRHRLGLLDDESYDVLVNGHPETVDLTAVRPTGRVRSEHVEVEVAYASGGGSDNGTATVRGFLRPEEIATLRHTGQALVARSTEGRRALWPAWY